MAQAHSALAGSYDALCGGVKCIVTVTPDAISSPYGEILSSRVTYWGSTGDSSTSVGTGVATTILFGGIGLLGFLAKNHEYSFTVNGFDADGKKVSMQLAFKNDKPAKRLMAELSSVTGLGMGQTRTAEEILAAESGSQVTLQAITGSKELSLDRANATKLTVPVNNNCWSEYLKRNPAMESWAKSNPAQAQQNKKKFDDC